MANPLLSVLSQKNNVLNPQMKSQIKSLYKLYSGNPQGFVQEAMKNYPQLQNNPMLSAALSGDANPQQMVGGMLDKLGISEQEFKELLV